MRASKRGGGGAPAEAENVRGVTGHMSTLHHRLYHALNLGTRVYDETQKKWQCSDIEIQRHVVRSIAAFLDCFEETSNNPILKDSIADITGALVWILRCNNGAVISMSANTVVKLVSVVPNAMLQPYALDLARSLSSMLCFRQVDVAISCTVALNLILLSVKEVKEKEIWEILEETKVVSHIVGNLLEFSAGTIRAEYFQEMASLLSTISLRWPSSRYRVWSDPILMKVLVDINFNPDICLKVAALKVYSSLALCGHGAKKLLEDGNTILEMMISCMDKSSPLFARMEGFKLAQRLATGKESCLKMISMCCESLVKAIIHAMSWRNTCSGKVAKEQMRLLVEACRLALTTRWPGEHHRLFWRHRVVQVLLNLLLENFQRQPSEGFLFLEEQISALKKGLNANFLPNLRPYVWDMVGFLALHCEEDFKASELGNDLHINILVTCASLAFLDAIQKGHQICQNDIIGASGTESVSRAVLMMMYSPCKYIASKTRFALSEILKQSGELYVEPLIRFLVYSSSEKNFGLPNPLQATVCLVGLACYSGLPQYWKLVVENQGIEALLSFSSWYMRNNVHIGRSSFASHLQNVNEKRTCCWRCTEDWDDKDVFLLYALWALTELVHHSCSKENSKEIFCGKITNVKAQLCAALQEIRDGIYAPGPRWYAAHILSYFGYYGFKSKLGERIVGALRDEEFGDMQLILADGSHLSVHRVILALRCPSLLPPKEVPSKEEAFSGCEKPPGVHQRIRLSSHVDHQVLLKLLEFVYSGYVEVNDELVKKLKILARHCNVKTLLEMLSRKRVKWDSSAPDVDLSLALSPAPSHFSDIILEAKQTRVIDWTCCVCSSTVPHVHAHRVVLSSSCEYLRALFKSGMQESHSHSLKVPLSLEALIKLVNWFYTGELSNPPSGCRWNNMSTKEKLYELQPLVEIYWLSEFWILEHLQDVCARVIESCLESARELCVKLIQLAAEFSVWKLAELAAEYTAPIYHKLRDSGDLQELDEALVDMIRAASVRFSQESNDYSV